MKSRLSSAAVILLVSATSCGDSTVQGGAALHDSFDDADSTLADAVDAVGFDLGPDGGGDLGEGDAPLDAGDPDSGGDAGGDGAEATDDAGPAVEVLLPSGGAKIEGVVVVHVIAVDPSGVELLRVGVEGQLLLDTNPLPDVFLGAWDTLEADDGEHVLTIEARDTLGNETWLDATVEVHNGPGRLVSGLVGVGAPVGEVAFIVRDWVGPGEEGEILASGTTDALGHFSVTTKRAATSGWGLLVASGPGGTTFDPYSNVAKTLQADDSLAALVRLDGGEGGVVTQVNAWTTLSAHLATALRKAGDDKDSAPGKAGQWVAEHLQRPKPFDLAEVLPVLPGDPELVWPSPGAVVGLTHVGLGRLAGERGGDTFDAVRLLAADLSDTKLDGKGALPGMPPGWLAWPDETPVDIEDTRYTLAAQIDAWAAETEPLFTGDLDGLLDTLASDDGPLYPKGPGLEPFTYDEDPPTLAFVQPTPEEDAWVGGAPLGVAVAAADESALASFTLTADPEASIQAVVDGMSLTASVALTGVPDGPLLLTASAIDGSKHGLQTVIERTVQIDRTPPVLHPTTITPPEGVHLALESVVISVVATDGGSGVAAVTATVVGCAACGVVDLALAATDRWEGEVALPSDGPVAIELNATDAVGNEAHIQHTVVRDTEAPVVGAVSSLFADATKLTLLSELTTAEAPGWQQPANINLNKVCCLDGGPCAEGDCTSALPVLASELQCNAHSPVLRLAVTDAQSAEPELHYKLTQAQAAIVLGEGMASKDTGAYALSLCSGGVAKELPVEALLVLEYWATDAAGNTSDVKALQFQLDVVTPPLLLLDVPPPVEPDADDLLKYSLPEKTMHFPFGMKAPVGVSGNGYRVASWKLVNPHSIPLDVEVSPAKFVLRRMERRSYLRSGTEDSGCGSSKCSYLWSDWEYETQWFGQDCGPTIQPKVEWTMVNADVLLWAGAAAVKSNDVVTLDAHSETLFELRAATQGSCALGVPNVHSYGSVTRTFYLVPKPGEICAAAFPTVPVTAVNFSGSASVSVCTLGSDTGTYHNPRIVGGFAVTPHVGSAAVAPFILTAQAALGEPRILSAKPVTDVLGEQLLWPNGMLPSNSPY